MLLHDVCATDVHPTLLHLEFKIEDFTAIFIFKYILHTFLSVCFMNIAGKKCYPYTKDETPESSSDSEIISFY